MMDQVLAQILAERGGVGGGLFDAPQPQPAVAPAVVPANPNPQRSFLGGMFNYQRPEGQTGAQRAALIGATLKDIGTGLSGGRGDSVEAAQAGFRGRAAEIKAERDKAVKAEALAKATAGGRFDGGIYLQTLAQSGLAPDIDDLAKIREATGGPKVLNTADGPFRYDDTTGEGEYVPGPFADKRGALLDAQIKAAIAQGDVRDSQGDYYDARAKQPYAPQRPRAGAAGGTSPALLAVEAALRKRGLLP